MILRRHLKIIYVPSYLPVIINKGLYHDYKKFFSGLSKSIYVLNTGENTLSTAP